MGMNIMVCTDFFYRRSLFSSDKEWEGEHIFFFSILNLRIHLFMDKLIALVYKIVSIKCLFYLVFTCIYP